MDDLLSSEFDRSKYLKADDLKTEKKFRIKEATKELLGTVQKEKKLVVWFTNDERGLVLNKTNIKTLRAAFGDPVSGWKGKVIIIFPTMTEMAGKMVGALRVRIPPPKQAAATGNGQAAPSPSTAQPTPPAQAVQAAPAASPLQQELDEFGQSPSSEKPSLRDDLDDEIGF
jgi:hypothetical protein